MFSIGLFLLKIYYFDVVLDNNNRREWRLRLVGVLIGLRQSVPERAETADDGRLIFDESRRLSKTWNIR